MPTPAVVERAGGFVPPAWMKIERPGVTFRPGAVKEAELSPDDDKRLADSLASSDILITGPSTMAIDAARFAFDNDPDQQPPRFYR